MALTRSAADKLAETLGVTKDEILAVNSTGTSFDDLAAVQIVLAAESLSSSGGRGRRGGARRTKEAIASIAKELQALPTSIRTVAASTADEAVANAIVGTYTGTKVALATTASGIVGALNAAYKDVAKAASAATAVVTPLKVAATVAAAIAQQSPVSGAVMTAFVYGAYANSEGHSVTEQLRIDGQKLTAAATSATTVSGISQGRDALVSSSQAAVRAIENTVARIVDKTSTLREVAEMVKRNKETRETTGSLLGEVIKVSKEANIREGVATARAANTMARMGMGMGRRKTRKSKKAGRRTRRR